MKPDFLTDFLNLIVSSSIVAQENKAKFRSKNTILAHSFGSQYHIQQSFLYDEMQ